MMDMQSLFIGQEIQGESPESGGSQSFLLVDKQENLQVKLDMFELTGVNDTSRMEDRHP